jgi:hypothetical protein
VRSDTDVAAIFGLAATAFAQLVREIPASGWASPGLGEDPVAAVDGLVQRALADVAATGNPLITVIGGLGIRLHTYLPTRTFELAVHGLDIARAARLQFSPPAEVLDAATALAARTAVTLW